MSTFFARLFIGMMESLIRINLRRLALSIVDIDIGSKIVLKEALVSGEECGKGSTFTYEVL